MWWEGGPRQWKILPPAAAIAGAKRSSGGVKSQYFRRFSRWHGVCARQLRKICAGRTTRQMPEFCHAVCPGSRLVRDGGHPVAAAVFFGAVERFDREQAVRAFREQP